MGLKIEEHLMVNTQLMKITGLYQVLNPHIRKIFGFNPFTCVIVIYILILTVAKISYVFNIYYCLDNFYQIVQYFMMLVATFTTTFKMYFIIQHSKQIWNCVQLTSINFLSYKHHNRQILETGRTKSKLFSTICTFMWLSVVLSWLLSPYILNKYYIEVNVENDIYYYRINVLNLIFPVNDKFYNKHFLTYYYIESIVAISLTHGLLTFDVILISMCITFAYQLKTIGNSYSTFGYVGNHIPNNIEYNESMLINDFKILIKDQQKVTKNMRNSFKIFGPVTLLQILSDSLNLILLSSIAIMNYLNGTPFISVSNLRFIMTSLAYMLHLYCTSALFSQINYQKESLNFAMYCSNWTGMSLNFRKLLLYAMQMNNAEQLKLKLTREKTVNFEMFTNIMRTTYSILSVLVKQYSKTS